MDATTAPWPPGREHGLELPLPAVQALGQPLTMVSPLPKAHKKALRDGVPRP
jgi:hypothetical protein